jgi:hypothetical protein
MRTVAHPASYLTGTEGKRRLARETDNSLPPSTQLSIGKTSILHLPNKRINETKKEITGQAAKS